MATYVEIEQLYSQGALEPQVRVAVVNVALAIIAELPTVPNHDARLECAVKAIQIPGQEAKRFLMGILVANKAASVAQIQSASDAAVQTNVDALVDAFAVSDLGV